VNGVKRFVIRFWRRNGWKGVIAVAAVVVAAAGIAIYSVVHQPETGGTVSAHRPDRPGRVDPGPGYAFDLPRGWAHDPNCGSGWISTIPFGDGCTKPDGKADAGVYLLSQQVAVDRPATDVAAELAPNVTRYRPCAGSSGEIVCLENPAQPAQKGQLRVRVYRTLAVIVLCVGTERGAILRGCDLVWTHIHVGS
jgi:hypothetical protein